MNNKNKKITLEDLAIITQEGFLNIETRFDGLEIRFDGLETRFDGLEIRFDGLAKDVEEIKLKLDNKANVIDLRETNQRLEGAENRLGIKSPRLRI